MLGSPRYMSPEQVRGDGDVDHRADIWALGVILFRFLSGMAPFGGQGKGISGALTSIVMDEPPSLKAIMPGVPEGARGGRHELPREVAREPASRRPRSSRRALAPFGSGEGRAAVARLVRSVEGRLPSGSPPNPSPAVSARPTRRFVLAGVVVALVAIPAGALALLGRDKPAAVTASSASAPPLHRPPTPEVVSAVEPSRAPEPSPSPEPATPAQAQAATPSAPARHAQPARPAAHPHAAPGPSTTSAVRTAATDDRY